MADVVLSEYQAAWPVQFGRVAAELAAVFPQAVVEHVGSTAVPGLCAKPVLDVLLGVAALDQLRDAPAALASLGYRYRPEYEAELPERRYFVRDAAELPRVHLHAVEQGGAFWRHHLAFRNALRADGVLRAQYELLKRQLAAAHAGDKAAYTRAKGPFIAAALANSGRATTMER